VLLQNADSSGDLLVSRRIMQWPGRQIGVMRSLLYGLTRNTLGVMLLRTRGDTAEDIDMRYLISSRCYGARSPSLRRPRSAEHAFQSSWLRGRRGAH
jgi:hypothetical protein